MKYGVDYRNMHTAIHGIVLFNSKKKAESAHEVLKSLKNGNISEEDYQTDITDIFDDVACGRVEEIDYRRISPAMNTTLYYDYSSRRMEEEKIRIVNPIQVDLYF